MKQGIQIFFIFVLFSGLMACAQLRQVREMPINDIDLSQLQDGTYTGDFTYGFLGVDFTYAVETTIQSNRITDIRVTNNRNTNHAKQAEGVIPRVIEAQSPNVDAHTGATTTSKALLKAIERSLVKGLSDGQNAMSSGDSEETDAETGATSTHHE
ncbi:FMN-binding domain protein [Candidatus Magnetomorum sp. HK-1]|nr:FMN-binding domain protein [Candidatus Magnetomorum sp. HK-1]